MAYQFPVVPVGSIVQVRLKMLWEAQKLMNTYHWRLSNTPAGATVETLCNQMDANFAQANNLYPTHKALRDGSCRVDHVDIQVLAPQRFLAMRYGKNEPGSFVTAADTPNMACNITRRGVGGKRSDVSSLHIPIPCSEEVFTGSGWTAAYLALLVAHCGVVQSNLILSGGATLEPVIYHKGKQPDHTLIGAVFYMPWVRTMRRRTIQRGE